MADAGHARDLLPGRRAGLADVEVLVPVPVGVHHGDARAPDVGAGDAGACGHVLEGEVAAVAVEGVGDEVARQVNVHQAVPVVVDDADAAAVVEIAVGVGVELVGVAEVVAEGQPAGVVTTDELKFGVGRSGAPIALLHSPRTRVRAGTRAGGQDEQKREQEIVYVGMHEGSDRNGGQT